MDARALGITTAALVGVLGCGQVREVFVPSPTEDGTDGTATTDAPTDETHGTTGGSTSPRPSLDRDTTTGLPPITEGGGTTGEPTSERVQACAMPGVPIPDGWCLELEVGR